MGRFISTGIVYQYVFKKSDIEETYQREFWKKVTFSELREEIIEQMFPEIYTCDEDDDFIWFTLSDILSADDILSVMRTFYSFQGDGTECSEDFAELCDKLKGKTVADAFLYSKEKSSYLFQYMGMGYIYQYYAYPLTLSGKRFFNKVHVSVIMIEMSSAKTATEDDLLSYDFFTDLLRYRLKPEKLADSMLVFLSP